MGTSMITPAGAQRAMTGLAAFRVALGAASWVAPGGVSRYLASTGEARGLWHRLWLLCDGADTAMGARMVARRELGGVTGATALATTAGAPAVDLAALVTRGRRAGAGA